MHPGETDRTLLSPARRRADRARLADEVVDVLVIGGGVTGAGAALDAASRGLSVGLLEARDWASGTSSRSSKLIHGGLRYLEQLAFPLVFEALARAGPARADHRPAPGDAPAVPAPADQAGRGSGRTSAPGSPSTTCWAPPSRSGRGVPAHRHLSRKATLAAFPGLRGDVVRGAIRYWDAQVDDARHTLAVVRTAAGYGARVALQRPRGRPAAGRRRADARSSASGWPT